MKLVKFIDVNPMHNRAICLAQDGNDMFFGIVIKRRHGFNKDQWYFTLYCSLTIDEFNKIQKHESAEALSFLGIGSDTIMVPKQLCDTFLVQQPQHFAGIHLTVDQSSQIDNEKMTLALEHFCQQTRDVLYG